MCDRAGVLRTRTAFGMFARMGLISQGDLSLFHFADTARSAWSAIVAVPAAR